MSSHPYRLLEEIEEVARRNLAEARSVYASIEDPSLRHYVQLLEAHSLLSMGISRLLSDYILLSTTPPTRHKHRPEQEDLELVVRLLTEFLSREERLIRRLSELGEALGEGLAKRIVAAWLACEKELVEEVSRLRSRVFQEMKLAQERARPEEMVEE